MDAVDCQRSGPFLSRKIRVKFLKSLLTSGGGSSIISKPSAKAGREWGSIAQLVEHMPYKHGVTGSSPVVPTTFLLKGHTAWRGSSVG